MCSEGYSTWPVCLCVCLCVCYPTSHFPCDYSCHKPQTILTFSKVLSDFLWKCFVAKLERFLLVWLYDKSAIFCSAENAHAYESGHVASGHFVLGRDVLCEFDYWPLAVSMPPTKVCPQCKAAVPVRRKTCERCDLVFWFKRKAECNLWEKTV